MSAPEWKPIHTAVPFERILVCGYQPRLNSVAGYWWWHEDEIGLDGRGIDHPDATHWAPIILPEQFPARNSEASA